MRGTLEEVRQHNGELDANIMYHYFKLVGSTYNFKKRCTIPNTYMKSVIMHSYRNHRRHRPQESSVAIERDKT